MSMVCAINSTYNIDLVVDGFQEIGLRPTMFCHRSATADKWGIGVRQLGDRASYRSALLRAALSGDVHCVHPTSNIDEDLQTDSELVAALAEVECPALIHSPGVAAVTGDKERTKAFCADSGILTARSYLATSRHEAVAAYRRLEGIVVCKRPRESGGRGQEIISDEKALAKLDFKAGPYLMEPFLDGMEVSANCLFSGGAFTMMPPVLKGRTSSSNIHAIEKVRLAMPVICKGLLGELSALCQYAGTILGANGWMEFELVIAEGRLYLLEINARISGTTRASYLSCGRNPYAISANYLLSGEMAPSPVASRIALEVPIYQPADSVTSSKYHVHYSAHPRGAIGRISLALDDARDVAASVERLSDADHVRTALEQVAEIFAFGERETVCQGAWRTNSEYEKC